MKKLVDVNRNFGILKAGLEFTQAHLMEQIKPLQPLQRPCTNDPYIACNKRSMVYQTVNLGLTPSEEALKVTVTQARH